MKVTFVYPDLYTQFHDWPGSFYVGIASLSAVLKREGIETSIIHITHLISKSEFIKRIEDEDPDLIGFSSTSHGFSVIKKLASWLVEAKVRILKIYGGVHPTIAPEESIEINGIDMICQGEGEGPLVELCHRMSNKEDINDIQNLWIRAQGTVIRNPLRPLIEDLDQLPFPDRSIFSYPDLLDERDGLAVFMASRGCPYNCTYCCNHLFRKIYGNKGSPVRFRSVDHLIEEIKQVLGKYSFITGLIFHDDILFFNKKWSEEFAEKYSMQIRLPFVCNARADVTDESVIRLLKKAGCSHVKFGLESGNEAIRFNVLNRRITDGQIKKAFAGCKKAGLNTISFNMVGLPYETPGAILDTIKLNAAIGVDLMQISVFQPYQGTQIADLCQKQHFLDSKDLGPDFFSSSILKLGTVSSSQIFMFRDYIPVFVRYYQLLQKFPLGISKVAIAFSDKILSFKLTSRILTLIFLPVNYVNRRLLVMRGKAKRALRKANLIRPVERLFPKRV